jgi:hypothetical protein
MPKVIAMIEFLLQPGWPLERLAIPKLFEVLTMAIMVLPKESVTGASHVSLAIRRVWIIGEV